MHHATIVRLHHAHPCGLAPEEDSLSTGGLSTKLIECRLLERGPPFGAGRASEGALDAILAPPCTKCTDTIFAHTTACCGGASAVTCRSHCLLLSLHSLSPIDALLKKFVPYLSPVDPPLKSLPSHPQPSNLAEGPCRAGRAQVRLPGAGAAAAPLVRPLPAAAAGGGGPPADQGVQRRGDAAAAA